MTGRKIQGGGQHLNACIRQDTNQGRSWNLEPMNHQSQTKGWRALAYWGESSTPWDSRRDLPWPDWNQWGALVFRDQALFLYRRTSYSRIFLFLAKLSLFWAGDPTQVFSLEFEWSGKRHRIYFVLRQKLPPTGILELFWRYLLEVIWECSIYLFM